MRFQWAGSTWTTDAGDSPSYPVGITDETIAQVQRTYAGAARYYYRAGKKRFALTWENVGTNSPAVYIRAMLAQTGTVELAWAEGTFNAHPVPGSLAQQETGYSVYAISAEFVEA